MGPVLVAVTPMGAKRIDGGDAALARVSGRVDTPEGVTAGRAPRGWDQKHPKTARFRCYSIAILLLFF
jgi:predicted RecB family endonuclease